MYAVHISFINAPYIDYLQSLRGTIEPHRKPAGAHCMCLMRVLFLANLYVASLSDHNIKLSRFQRLVSCCLPGSGDWEFVREPVKNVLADFAR